MGLTELLDRAEIHDVLMRYCRGVDRADMAIVRGAFHDDARIDFPDDVYVGTPEGFCAFLAKDLSLMVRSKHAVGSTTIEIDGDAAHVEAYLTGDIESTEYHRWHGGFTTVCGRYIDRFEKRGGSWKISHHTLVLDWQRLDQVGGFFKVPEAQLGSRDGTDFAVTKKLPRPAAAMPPKYTTSSRIAGDQSEHDVESEQDPNERFTDAVHTVEAIAAR